MRQTYSLLLLVSTMVTFAQSGTLDPSFGNDGVVSTAISPKYNYVEASTVQTDGKILVADNAGTTPTLQMTIVRYNADGSLDSSFSNGGTLL